MAELVRFLHASLLVADLDRAKTFYEGVLGLVPSPARPEMAFPGVWYDLGDMQIHLLRLPNSDPEAGRPEHGGRDRHLAFAVSDWAGFRQRLEAAGLPYTLSRSGRRALFVRDPDGNTFELVEIGPE